MSDASNPSSPTSARALLGLSTEADDATFIGVARGSTREAIIAAARARLAVVARNSVLSNDVREAARLEIRDAAQRLIADSLDLRAAHAATAAHAASAAHAATAASDSRGASDGRAGSIAFNSIAAAVFMRRDPRRARMFYARAAEQSQAEAAGTHAHLATTSTAHSLRAHEPGSFDLEFDITGEGVRRVPWLLALFVVLSVLLLIAEIFYLQGAVKAPAQVIEPQVAPRVVESNGTRSDGEPFVDRTKKEFASGSAVVAPPAKRAENATPLTKAPVVKISDASEANRKLRDRWQRMTQAAMDIQPVAQRESDAAQQKDPLASSLREIIVLERLWALDLAARKLLSGSDESASLLLDTLPSDSSVTVASHPSIEFTPSPQSDGELEKGLQKSQGVTEGRASRLRTFRARAESPGPRDARTLVHEALKGPNRTTRTIAQGILVDRGGNSRDVLEAIEERFTEIANDPALSGMIRAFSGVDPDGVEGAAVARAAIIDRILHCGGSRQSQIDRATGDLAATLRTCAAQFGVTTTASDPSEVLRVIVKAVAAPTRRGARAHASAVQEFVLDGTALLHEEAAALRVRRPAEESVLDEIVQQASFERSRAVSALGQAIANARGSLALDALRLAVPSVRRAKVQTTMNPHVVQWNAPAEPATVSQWSARLEALSPTDAQAYFLLGEEVADASDSAGSLVLARQLFALAGGIDSGQFGASAALALASLEPQSAAADPVTHEEGADARWRAVAARFSDHVVPDDAPPPANAVGSAVRGAVIEAIVQYRRGFGRRATDRLKSPQVRALFESVMAGVPGTSEEFDKLAAIHLRGDGTPLSAATVDALLRVEQALLHPRSERWAVALALGGDEPVVDAPIGSPREIFGLEAGRDRWKRDRWVDEKGR